MIQVSLVPHEYIRKVWPIVEPMLSKSVKLSSGRYSTEHLLQELLEEEQTLWVALDDLDIIGCTTIRIIKYPSGSISLSYEELAGSRFKEWMDEGHRVCSAYARDHHATRLEFKGRHGWGRYLSKLGYRRRAVMYELDLEV